MWFLYAGFYCNVAEVLLMFELHVFLDEFPEHNHNLKYKENN